MPIIKSIRKDRSRSENEKVSYKPPLKITGGDRVYTAGGYTIHLFLREGDHQLKVENMYGDSDMRHLTRSTQDVEILMVGAGGTSGNYSGGGGGGEVLFISRSIGTGSYNLSVAPGGSSNNGAGWATGRNGAQTTGFGETAKGGGAARASDDSLPAGNNGTQTEVATGGGGSSRTAGYFGQQGTSVGTGVTRHGGFRGGQESAGNDGPNYPGGGGGGAGQSRSGNTGGGGNGQPGGDGVQYGLTGTQFYWGGGGGGQTYYTGNGGNGGLGGGGAGSGGSSGASGGAGFNPGGSTSSSSSGGNGGANTGGGGGGGNGQNTSPGGGGGSGIIVVRYTQG